MTLDELRALRPRWQQPGPPTPIEDVVERFCQFCLRGANPADLTDEDLMAIFGAVLVLDQPSVPDAAKDFAEAVAREYADRVKRHQGAAAAALNWIEQSERITQSHLVAWLRCPQRELMATMYYLPKNIEPGRDSGGLRLLIKPTKRGGLSRIGVRPNAAIPARAVAWWYVSDDDVWDLGCKKCLRPVGGIRAGDFLGEGGRGYSVVLA